MADGNTTRRNHLIMLLIHLLKRFVTRLILIYLAGTIALNLVVVLQQETDNIILDQEFIRHLKLNNLVKEGQNELVERSIA